MLHTAAKALFTTQSLEREASGSSNAQRRESEAGKQSSHFIASLHGFRGLAALSVLWAHTNTKSETAYLMSSAGVITFLLLSGNLITGLLLRNLSKATSAWRGLVFFGMSRAARIYPAMLVAAAVASYFGLADGRPRAEVYEEAATSLLQVENFYGQKHEGGALAHTWYMATEQQFYTFWPLIVLVLAKRSLALRAGGLLACYLLIAALNRLQSRYVKNQPFFGGVLPFYHLVTGGAMQLLSLAQCRLLQWRWLAWAGIVCLSVQAFIVRPPYVTDIHTVQVLLSIYCAMIIHGAQMHGNTFLEQRIFVFLGRISYSLFIFHVPLLKITKKFGDGDLLAFCVAAASMMGATASTFLIEEPIRDAFKRYAMRKMEALEKKQASADAEKQLPIL